MAVKELKSRMLRLLREDEEFRYAVAGLLGLEEILKRLDRHEAELVRLREDMNKLRGRI
jgi:ribosomal protein L7Ae-like RNA K-turn-binding protein